jgi:uncharacterized protein (TIGR02453 family)
MAAPGFSAGTLRFLRGLDKNNAKAWFDAHRCDYENDLLEPAKIFVEALGDKLHTFAPGVIAEPRINGSIRRMNRDLRFSKDKRPYKNYLDLNFPEGRKDTGMCGVSFFIRVTPKSLVLGAGAHMFAPDKLKAYRDAVLDEKRGREIHELTRKLSKTGYRVSGLHFARPPRGMPADHPRAELLRHAGLYAYLEIPAGEDTIGPRLLADSTAHFKKLHPLNEWLLAMT